MAQDKRNEVPPGIGIPGMKEKREYHTRFFKICAVPQNIPASPAGMVFAQATPNTGNTAYRKGTE